MAFPAITRLAISKESLRMFHMPRSAVPFFVGSKKSAASKHTSRRKLLQRTLGLESLESRAMLTATPLSAMASVAMSDLSGNTQLVGALSASGPEIAVLDGSTEIASGPTTLIDIGSAFGGKAGPSKTFTIRNDGDQTLTLSKKFVSTSHFTVSQPLTTSLAAGQTTTFKVTLKTASIWTGTERVSFTNNDLDNGDGVESPFTFSVSGSVTPVPPEITVLLGKTPVTSNQAAPIDFGTGILGMAGASKTFTIRNDGKQTLLLTAPVAGTSHFTVTQPTKTSLAPGKTATFKVTLNTGEVWTGAEQIMLASNDADNGDGVENPFVLNVSGKVSQLVLNISNPAPRNEGNSSTTKFPFVVTLSPSCPKSVTVKYATADVLGTAGVDYTATHGTLTFSPGQTQKTINVLVKGDTLYEPNNQTFAVNLSAATLATIVQGTGVGTIVNDDSMPTISVSDDKETETNSGEAGFFFDITLSKASAVPVTIQRVFTADNTATLADGDYAIVDSSDWTFKPGETKKSVLMSAYGDTKFEPDETFFLKISGVTGATVLRDTGIGTIVNDDFASALASSVASKAVASPVVASVASSASLTAQSVAAVAPPAQSKATGAVQDQAMTSLLNAFATTQKVKSPIVSRPEASAVDETFRLMLLNARL